MRPAILFRRGVPALAVAALVAVVLPSGPAEAPRPEPAVPASSTTAPADVSSPAHAARDAEPAPASRPVLDVRRGEATYYHDALHGRTTASGVPYDRNALVAAHRSLPFGTLLRVTNTENGREVLVRVVDRGPFAPGHRAPAILDLSRRAAGKLDFIRQGRALVRAEVLEWGDG